MSSYYRSKLVSISDQQRAFLHGKNHVAILKTYLNDQTTNRKQNWNEDEPIIPEAKAMWQ